MNFQLSLKKNNHHNNEFGQKAKILEKKNENAHEIRKKHGLCPDVKTTYFLKSGSIENALFFIYTPGHKPYVFFRISWAFSSFAKIFAFCPNLLIFFQRKLKVHTFRILSCARQFYFECWKFIEIHKIDEFSKKLILARARARAGVRMMKFEKYELSAFSGKKN